MKRNLEVIWSKRSKWHPDRLVRSLSGDLRGRVDQAFLFGSHAGNTATTESDIDLILVARTTRPWPERGKPFEDLRMKYGSVDLLVYTPEEWRRMEEQPSTLIRHARRTWKQIV